MKKSPLFGRILSALVLIALVTSAYMVVARPYQLGWGATDEEIARSMPGDELSHRPTFLSADRIVPELQQVAVGDPLPLSAAGGLVFNAIVPNRYLVWSGASAEFPGGFTGALYPVDAGHTRLVSRIQWSHHWTQPLVLALDLFTEFTDHLAVRKILQSVKDRVEGRIEPMMRANVEFGVYVWALVSYRVAFVLLLRCPLTRAGWLASLGAGIAWRLVWYAPIPVSASVAVSILVLWSLRWSRVKHGSPRST